MNSKQGRGMLRGGQMFGSCSALAMLVAIGCGEVTNLGENGPESGGVGGGSGTAAVEGGDASKAGSAPTEPGGGDHAGLAGGGSGGGQSGGGRAGSAHAGDGGEAFGEQAGFGGQGGDGVVLAPLPYPLNPTLPIDADCSCADPASVCNAARQCVPRCEPGGVCAVWRIDHDMVGSLTANDTLYFIVAAQYDDAGNPLPGEAGQESLWKAHYPATAPTKVALLGGVRNGLLSHFSGKTYLQSLQPNKKSVLSVDDAGSVVEHVVPDDTVSVSVSPDGVFTLAADGSISRLAVGVDGSFGTAFEALLPGEGDVAYDIDLQVLASDRLWRQYGSKLCSFDFADLQAAPRCMDGDYSVIYGTQGGRAVTRSEHDAVYDLNVDDQTSRYIWLPHDDSSGPNGTMAGGFITGWLLHGSDLGASMLARFPTEGPAKTPTPLIGQDVVRAMSNVDGIAIWPPAVTSDAVYWTQWFGDVGASRYIFRAPLPQ